MVDEWKEKLRCAQCGNTGMADLYQPEGASAPTVQFLPEGFTFVETQDGIDFVCVVCKVAVQP